MSDGFSVSAKKEAAAAPLFSRGAKIAFVAALIQTAGSIIISANHLKISVKTDSQFTKQLLDTVLTDIYKASSDYGSEKDIVLEGAYLPKLLADCGILVQDENGQSALTAGIDPQIIKRAACAGAYIKGAFLGSGSASVSKGYRIEFSLTNNTRASEVRELLVRLGINAKIINRKALCVVYVKGVEPVSDLLALMGCSKAVMAINELFAERNINQTVNRRSNCDLANIDKTVDLAQEQLKIIDSLKKAKAWDKLDEKLKEAALARISNSEASMAQLAQMLNISKSGIVHRFKKLKQLYENQSNQ